MINFLQETLDFLQFHGKTTADVEFVSDGTDSINFEEFAKMANFNYDNGYGLQVISAGVVIVGDNWWAERAEYDGSEWWAFKTRPKKILKNHNRPFMIKNKDIEKYVEGLK